MSELTMGPYERHYYRLGRAIMDTVKQAQALLCGIQRGRERQYIVDCLDWCYGGGNYPQSLGELCIELAQDNIRKSAENDYLSHLNFVTGQTSDDWPISRDLHALRQAMYYKLKNHCVGDGVYDNTEYFQDQLSALATT